MPAEGLTVLLRAFRLPTMAAIWSESVIRAEREDWGYQRLLQHLCESEAQDRRERKVQRLLHESGLPEGKTLGNLEEKLLPVKIRRLLPTLLEGRFVDRGENLLVFGLPGRGKTHFLAAVGRELVLRHRYPVLFTPTFKLVQRLLAAKQELRLESELKRLDRFAAVILDDIGYVQQDRQEMEVLFTFLAERYERRSVLISSNLVFSKWDQIFKDPMTTMAAIDRLVHHATILEFNNESVRGQQARGRQKGQADAPEGPFGSTPSLAPDGAKDSVPPKGPSPQD
ncbi:MAG: ATP-binding protein [Verrucomicrobiales bacterium]|nr:ATP-binding protein [Verrucomicrobiales bacterium]